MSLKRLPPVRRLRDLVGKALLKTAPGKRLWRVKRAVERELEVQTPALEHTILIGTHHKTGTVWWRSVLTRLSRELGLTLTDNRRSDLLVAQHTHDLLFDVHSQTDLAALTVPFRALHLIRDPRDVVVSGCFYHQRSDEKRLHVPREELGGRTYQQAINALPSMADKLLFEMERRAAETIRGFDTWPSDDERVLLLKYEDLIVDVQLVAFHRAFAHLGLPGHLIPRALQIAWESSLFSGRVHDHKHVHHGGARQWPRHFERVHRERFVELFGDVLVRYGYEPDDAWVDDPPALHPDA